MRVVKLHGVQGRTIRFSLKLTNFSLTLLIVEGLLPLLLRPVMEILVGGLLRGEITETRDEEHIVVAAKITARKYSSRTL